MIVEQNDLRMAKPRRAMLESKPPRNSQRKLTETMSSGAATSPPSAPRRKVEQKDITETIANVGQQSRYTRLRGEIMNLTECSKRTAQLAISQAREQGWLVQANGQYRLPF
jgi:hypothetical protein